MASSSASSATADVPPPMASPAEMGIFDNAALLQNNPHLQAAMDRLENDPRYSEEAIAARVQAAQEQQPTNDEEKRRPSAASSGAAADNVPDVISFGFAQLVFQFLNALHVRFPTTKPITKAYELFWDIVEQAPQMPYEKFRDIVDALGAALVQRAIDEEGDSKMQKREKAARKADKLRKFRGEVAFALFEEREALRKRLATEPSDVSDADKQHLYEKFEKPALEQVVKIDLFRLAKLDRVWQAKLDLKTRDRMCEYLKQLCQVTNLINNFDPRMKEMMSKVSLDSVNAAKGKNNGEIDINALLDELQERVLNDEEFMEKISEIAMNQ